MVKPLDIKIAGDDVPSTALWEQHKEGFMQSIVYRKFAQNEELKQKLLDTLDIPLYECTNNRWWGSGYKLDSPEWNTGPCPGLNKMGQILMDIRRVLRKQKYKDTAMIRSTGAIINAVLSQNQLIQDEAYDEIFPIPNLDTQPGQAQEAVQATEKTIEMDTNAVGEGAACSVADSEELMEQTEVEEDSVNISASSTVSATPTVPDVGNVTGEDGKLDMSKVKNWSLPKVNELHHSLLQDRHVSGRSRNRLLRNTFPSGTPSDIRPQAASTPQIPRKNQSLLLQWVRDKLHPVQKKKGEKS